MRVTSPSLFFVLVGLSLLLASCAGQGMFNDPGSAPTVASQGGYKVGRPYKIKGRWYYPQEDFRYSEVGTASWYGPGFHGRRTARGDVYDMHAMTAAHRTLQMPSLVRVTNLDNGREVDLLINDRGPFAGDRIIDVSKRAAQELGFRKDGTARVRVRVLEAESRTLKQAALKGQSIDSPAGKGRRIATQQRPSVRPSVTARARLGGLSGAAVAMPDDSRIFVQAGAFADRNRAERLRRQLRRLSAVSLDPVAVGGQPLYRVRLGPIDNRTTAERVRTRVAAAGYPEARVVID